MFMFNLEPIILREDEYLDNGIIYCRHCRTPRSWKSDDGEMSGRCACACQSKAFEEEQARNKAEERMRELNRLKRNSLLGERYKNSSFDKLDLNRPQSFVRAVERCKKFCENWKEVKKRGLGIYLYGDSGLGKTELTACICNNLLEKYVTVLVTSFIELSKRIRASFQSGNYETEEEIIDMFASVDLLILDDIGTDKMRKGEEDTFMQNRVYDVINRRYVKLLPTVFTSNYSINALLEERGIMSKTIDRINQMVHAIIHLEGTSYRQVKVEQETKVF